MDRTPCHHTLATRQHQRTIDADAARGERFAELQNELAHEMRKALSGLTSFVPGTQIVQGTLSRREVLRSAAEEVLEGLDHMACMEALMLALKDSACPLVGKLRGALIDAYVRDNADDVAEARGVA